MKTSGKIVVYITFLIGCIMLLILPRNKYEWMEEIDPSGVPLPDDIAFSNRALFAFLIMLVITIPQVLLAVKSKNTYGKAFSIALTLLALLLWWVRWQ